MTLIIILASLPVLCIVGMVLGLTYSNEFEAKEKLKNPKVKKVNPVYEKAANDLFNWQGENLNNVYICSDCKMYHRRHTLITTYILKAIKEKNYNVSLQSNGQCPVCNSKDLLLNKQVDYPTWLDEHHTCLKVTDKSNMRSIKSSLEDLFKQWEVIKQAKEYDDYSERYEKLKANYKEEM